MIEGNSRSRSPGMPARRSVVFRVSRRCAPQQQAFDYNPEFRCGPWTGTKAAQVRLHFSAMVPNSLFELAQRPSFQITRPMFFR